MQVLSHIKSRHQLVVVRLLYFLTYAGFSAFLTYFYVYLTDVEQLTGLQVGLIASIQQLNSVYSPPVWGMLADRFGRLRVYLVASLAVVLLFYGFYALHSFAFYLAFMVVFAFFFDAVSPLLDNLALDTLRHSGHASFGELRLWGSIGWATATLLTGQLLHTDTLVYIFAIASTVLLLCWLIASTLYAPVKDGHAQERFRLKSVLSLFRLSTRLNILLGMMLVYGLVSAPIHMFVNLYFRSIGADYQDIGLAFAVQSIFELPFFFFGKRIIRWMGTERALLFSVGITGLRMLCYGLVPVTWVGIVVGATHGVGFALFFLAIVEYLHGFVPKHLQATGHSLIYSFYFGAGVGMGNLLTGQLKDWLGMQQAMLLQGTLVSGLFGLLALLLWWEHRAATR